MSDTAEEIRLTFHFQDLVPIFFTFSFLKIIRVQTLNVYNNYHYLFLVNSTDETKENNRISIS